MLRVDARTLSPSCARFRSSTLAHQVTATSTSKLQVARCSLAMFATSALARSTPRCLPAQYFARDNRGRQEILAAPPPCIICPLLDTRPSLYSYSLPSLSVLSPSAKASAGPLQPPTVAVNLTSPRFGRALERQFGIRLQYYVSPTARAHAFR